MYCENCGTKLKEDTIFCTSCGHKIGTDVEDNTESTITDEIKSKDIKGTWSLVFGIASIVISILGIPFGITGLVLSKKEKPKSSLGTAGKVTSIIGISISCLSLIFFLLITFVVYSYNKTIRDITEDYEPIYNNQYEESFYSGETTVYSLDNKMYYIMPECWLYEKEKSSDNEVSHEFQFDYTDSIATILVKNNVEQSDKEILFENYKKSIEDYYTINDYEIKNIDGIDWQIITTNSYYDQNEYFYDIIYNAFSLDGTNQYLLHFKISNDMSYYEKNRLLDSIDFIIEKVTISNYSE